MFLRSKIVNNESRVTANDAATSVLTIAFFLFLVFMSMNIMFQAFTKMRMATAADVAARYLATHEDGSGDYVRNVIVASYGDTAFIKLRSGSAANKGEFQVNWSARDINGCIQQASNCDNSIKGTNGLYNYRQPFVVVIRMNIPALIEMPLLSGLNLETSVYSISSVEIISN